MVFIVLPIHSYIAMDGDHSRTLLCYHFCLHLGHFMGLLLSKGLLQEPEMTYVHIEGHQQEQFIVEVD